MSTCPHCGVRLEATACPNKVCDQRVKRDDDAGLRAFLEHHRRRVGRVGWRIA